MYKVHTEVLEKCKKQLKDSNDIVGTAINMTKDDIKIAKTAARKKMCSQFLTTLDKLYDNNEKLIKLLEDNYYV